MLALPLTGRCGCGAVAFEISRPLAAAAYCHCTRCQARTGTAVQASAAIDGDPGVRPMARQFVAYAAPWEPIPDDGLPRFDERAPG